MGDALRDRLSDRGSIPLRSIYGTSRKDSIYAAFREFFLLSLLLVDIRKFFADTESDGDRMKKTLLNRKKQNKKSDYYDYNLVAVIVLLVCFGLVMLYSTSSYMAEVNYGNDMFYFKKQALISAACLIGALFISKILDYHILLPFTTALYVASLILMGLVRTPLGHSSHGATRWLYRTDQLPACRAGKDRGYYHDGLHDRKNGTKGENFKELYDPGTSGGRTCACGLYTYR